jgi:hypothetical protein
MARELCARDFAAHRRFLADAIDRIRRAERIGGVSRGRCEKAAQNQ